MIVAETKMKSIPETCTKCKFSVLTPVYDSWGHYGDIDKRICLFTKKEVPYVYIKKKKELVLYKM